MNAPIAPVPVFAAPGPCDICGSLTEVDVCGLCRQCIDGVDHG